MIYRGIPVTESRRQFFQRVEEQYSAYAQQAEALLGETSRLDASVQRLQAENIEILPAGSRKAPRQEFLEADMLLNAPDTINDRKATEATRAAWVTLQLEKSEDYKALRGIQGVVQANIAQDRQLREDLFREYGLIQRYLEHLDAWIRFFAAPKEARVPAATPAALSTGPSSASTKSGPLTMTPATPTFSEDLPF